MKTEIRKTVKVTCRLWDDHPDALAKLAVEQTKVRRSKVSSDALKREAMDDLLKKYGKKYE